MNKKNIKERLSKLDEGQINIELDNVEYEIEKETMEEDDDWNKKLKEEEKRGYDENNWHEGDYENPY